MSKISIQTLDFIKKLEGFCSHSYKCPAGVWTIGYGTTIYSNGVKVKDGDKINEEDALFELYKYIEKHCLPVVEDLEKQGVKLNENQRTAIMSLVYNIGAPAFNRSKCKECIIKNNVVGACKNWDWKRSNGVVLNGLIKRRNEEIELMYGIKGFWKYTF